MSADYKLVIPARHASTRLPGKPLALINGQPMIWHVYQCAKATSADEIVIATDHADIADVCAGFGADVVMTSENHPSGTDRIAEVAKLRGWSEHDIVVNLQGDEPLTPPQILEQVAQNLHAHPMAGIATLCSRISSASELMDPHKVKVVRDVNNYALYFSRAPIPWERDVLEVEQSAEKIAFRHIGIYAYRVSFLNQYAEMAPCALEQLEKLEQLRAMWYGIKIHVDQAIASPGHGVDTEEDLVQVAALLRTMHKN